MRLNATGCLTLVILASFTLMATSFDITVTKGGYEGIIVAIHRNVTEDINVIENIKKMFVSGSKYLFSATGQRLYFKDVTIVIPETWKEEYNQTSVFSDYYSDSHIRIAESNPEFGDAPYTLQPGECGDQGEYVHFTPKFVINENGFTSEVYGEPGKQLVHEWAHFRYGVFDEYGSAGDRRFPLFYLDGGKIRPSTCVQDVKGWIEREDGQPCTLYENNFVGDDCLFIPNMEEDGQSLRASIMYMPFLPTMFSFCEDDTQDSSKKHNWRAPTKQNAFCKYKSTFEVISKHPDLKNSTTKLANDTKTEPKFNILRFVGNEDRKVVLVMDVSGSMGGTRIKRLNSAAKRFILDTLPHNVSLGMVQFESTATKLTKTLIRLSNATIRDTLSNRVPSTADGGTSIGSGLIAAMEILKENGGKTEGATIILITDGEDGDRDKFLESEKDVINAKIIVNTIAMGGTAEKLLENLAIKTGGRSFYFPDLSQDASGLDSAFVASTSSQVDVDFRPITLVGQAITITNETVQEVIIDKELGKNTEFSFRGAELNQVQLSLTSPDGKTYSEDAPEFNGGDASLQRKKFFFQTAKSGKWLVMFNLTGTAPISVTFNLASEVIDADVQPVRVKSWFDKTEVKFPASVKVLARVTKGFNVVLSATVHAVVIRPGVDDYPLILRDNGAGADAIKDDGIYSAYFRAFSGNGRYAAVATVLNDGNAKIKIPGRNYAKQGGSGAPAIPRNRTNVNIGRPPVTEFDKSEFKFIDGPIPNPEFDTEPAEEFTRNVDLGNFQLKDFKPGPGGLIFPPDRVTDLSVEYIVDSPVPVEVTNRTMPAKIILVGLRWTAVANGVDDGTVSGVEIRGSLNGDDLVADFQKGRLLLNNQTWSPLAPGEVQTSVFAFGMDATEVTLSATDIYFALVSINNAGEKSEMSNIGVAHLGYYETTNFENAKVSGNKAGMIIGIVIGVIIGIALVGLIVKYVCKK